MQPFEKYQSFIKQFPESKDVFKKMQAWHIANKPNMASLSRQGSCIHCRHHWRSYLVAAS